MVERENPEKRVHGGKDITDRGGTVLIPPFLGKTLRIAKGKAPATNQNMSITSLCGINHLIGREEKPTAQGGNYTYR